MNRKLKKMQRERLSTRQLMGITQLTDHGIKTANGEIIFYLLKPGIYISNDFKRNVAGTKAWFASSKKTGS